MDTKKMRVADWLLSSLALAMVVFGATVFVAAATGCGELGTWLTSPTGGNEPVAQDTPLGEISQHLLGGLSPWWLSLGLLFFKRMRENALGAPAAVLAAAKAASDKDGAQAMAQLKDAGEHLLALTPMFHTPSPPAPSAPKDAP